MGHESQVASTQEDETEQHHSGFEAAADACGFGIFNICLLFAALPGLWATIFETTTISYVLPAAQCDLKLTLMEKGALNAVTFGGMILSALPWGILADTYGRKYILVSALIMEGTITLLSLISRTTVHLMVFKFFGGLISCGPVAIFVSYITEFHGIKYRRYIVITIGLINSVPLIVLPTIAALILPHRIHYDIGFLKLNSWKTFIAVTALPALLSGFLLLLFPESPKFLMSQGKNDKAIKAFKRIYAMNKFKKQDTYPITTLLDETSQRRQTIMKQQMLKGQQNNFFRQFIEGIKQFPLLFTKDYVAKTIMVCCMYFSLILSVNTIRLWLPQYFSTVREMKYKGYTDFSTCNVLQYNLNRTLISSSRNDGHNKKCTVHIVASSYYDNIIINAGVCVNYILTTLLLKVIGNNILLRIYMGIACVSLLAKYWSKSALLALILSSVYTAFAIVCITLLLNTAVNLYPTSIRTMAVIFLMSWGRLGGLIGNILLPLIMAIHCAAMYVFFSATILCSIVISFFLPNTTKEPLK